VRDFGSLIEAPFASSQWVDRNRDENDLVQIVDSLVVSDCLGDHLAKREAEPSLLLILHPVDQITRRATATEFGSSEVETELAVAAVRAAEIRV